MKLPILAGLALVCLTLSARAADVTVAVASNFLSTAEKLADVFEEDSGFDVVLTHGSTGQIFAQISNGAPFDVFLSADAARPDRLVAAGRAAEARTYAFGRLVLISRAALTVESVADAVVGRNVALADPTVAPYGLAATAAMERLGLDTARFQPILVANVGQAATVFQTRNADFAFVAASLLPRVTEREVLDLAGLYPPIRQKAARVTPAGRSEAVDAFWTFLFDDRARAIIEESGYDLAE